jgi:hypothetical protein
LISRRSGKVNFGGRPPAYLTANESNPSALKLSMTSLTRPEHDLGSSPSHHRTRPPAHNGQELVAFHAGGIPDCHAFRHGTTLRDLEVKVVDAALQRCRLRHWVGSAAVHDSSPVWAAFRRWLRLQLCPEQCLQRGAMVSGPHFLSIGEEVTAQFGPTTTTSARTLWLCLKGREHHRLDHPIRSLLA